MFCCADFPLASFNAARFPTPLPIATDVRMLLKLPLIGGIIFCGLLMRFLGLAFYKEVLCFGQLLQPHLKIRSAFRWRDD
jgi:hypothetical protein